MDEDLLQQLPAEYARLADRPEVMREAVEVLGELHEAVTRLGDAIVAAGMAARTWRTPEADLRLISDRLPDSTLDDLITRLAEFAAGTGPDWLRGDRAAIARFHQEAADLDAVMRVLRAASQRLRLAPSYERVLPIEMAFAHVRVMTTIEQVAMALGDLVALAPFMGPLTAKQWKALKRPQAKTAAAPAAAAVAVDQVGGAASSAASTAAASASPQDAIPTTRLREYARTAPLDPRLLSSPQPVTVRRTSRQLTVLMQPLQGFPRRVSRLAHSLQDMPRQATKLAQSIQQGVAALAARVSRLPVRMVAVLALILVLAVGAGVLELTHADQPPQPMSQAPAKAATLVISPARLTLACAPHGRSSTLTLKNPTTRAISWHLHVPAGLVVSPTHDYLAAGRSVTLRATVTSPHLKAGTIAIVTSAGTLAVPYTTTCK